MDFYYIQILLYIKELDIKLFLESDYDTLIKITKNLYMARKY